MKPVLYAMTAAVYTPLHINIIKEAVKYGSNWVLTDEAIYQL